MNIIKLSTDQDLATLISNINKNFNTIASYSQTQTALAPQPVIRPVRLSELEVKEFLQKTYPSQKNIGDYSAYDISGMQVACCYDENDQLVSSFPFSYIDKRFHNTDLLQSIPASSLVGQTDMTGTLIYQDGQWNAVQNIPCIYSDGSDLYYRLNGTDTSLRINASEIVGSNKIPSTCVCVASDDLRIGEVSGESVEDADLSLIDGSLAFVLYSPGIYYISMLSRSGSELRWSKNEDLRIDTNKGLSEVLANTGWVWQAYVSAQGIAAHSLFSKGDNLYLSLQKAYNNNNVNDCGRYLNVFNLLGVNVSEYTVNHSAGDAEYIIPVGAPVLPGEQWYLGTEENSTSNTVSEIGVSTTGDILTYKTRSQSSNEKTYGWTLLTIPPDVYELKTLYVKFPEGSGSHKIKFTSLFKKGAGLNIDEPTTIQKVLTSTSPILIGPFQHLNTKEVEPIETSTGTGFLRANKINAANVQVNKIVTHKGSQNLQLSNGNELQYIGFRYTFPWGKSTRWVWAHHYTYHYDKLFSDGYLSNNASQQSYNSYNSFSYAVLNGARSLILPLLDGSDADNNMTVTKDLSAVDPTFAYDEGNEKYSKVFIVSTEKNSEIDSTNSISISKIIETPTKIIANDINYEIYYADYKRSQIQLVYVNSSHRIDTDNLTVLRIRSNAPVGTQVPITALLAITPVMISNIGGNDIDNDMNISVVSNEISITTAYSYIANVRDYLFTIGYYTISIMQDGVDLWSEYYASSTPDTNGYVDGFSRNGVYQEGSYRDMTDTKRLTFIENISKIYKGMPDGVVGNNIFSGFVTDADTACIVKNITDWYISNNIYKSSSASFESEPAEVYLASIIITQNTYTTNTQQLSQIIAAKADIIAKKK